MLEFILVLIYIIGYIVAGIFCAGLIIKRSPHLFKFPLDGETTVIMLFVIGWPICVVFICANIVLDGIMKLLKFMLKHIFKISDKDSKSIIKNRIVINKNNRVNILDL